MLLQGGGKLQLHLFSVAWRRFLICCNLSNRSYSIQSSALQKSCCIFKFCIFLKPYLYSFFCSRGCRMEAITSHTLSVLKNELFAKDSLPTMKWTNRHHPTLQSLKHGDRLWPSLKTRQGGRGHDKGVVFVLGTGRVPSVGGQDGSNGDENRGGLGGTRLGRIVGAGGRKLLEKLNSTRKNFPLKIFLLLLGFYTANALATILGQTGDWDILVAGIVVAGIEGIGMLMYRRPASVPTRRLQSLVGMVNYWKAGVCLGLFVDAFKLGS